MTRSHATPEAGRTIAILYAGVSSKEQEREGCFYERKAGEWRAEQDRIAEAIQGQRRPRDLPEFEK